MIQQGFLSADESRSLLQEIINTALWEYNKIKVKGGAASERRWSRFYADDGVVYKYGGTTRNSTSWSSALQRIKKKVEDELGQQFNCCIVNLYEDGKGRNLLDTSQ